jgi:hypothetical protein
MMMKKLAVLFSVALFLLISVACTKTASTPGGNNSMIEPGDKIGDFLITTGVTGKFTYGFDIACSDLSVKNTYSCKAAVGQAINVSTGLNDSTGGGKLDEVWARSNYQLFINDHPVDLKAFGTIDYIHPVMGTIRFANVVIIASKPGEITVRDTGVFDNGDPFTSTSTYVFSKP